MSEQTISEKSRQIREETAKYANTRGRVADVLDDINETKANKEDLDAAINDTLTPLVERVTAVEEQNTTQDTAISGKLDKTTTTISEPNAEFKYAYLTNESNETRRMLAGDLGKNVANSKPTSVAGSGLNMGAIWEIATNGFPLRIKGLPDKSSNPTFDKKLKINSDGEIGISNDIEAVINLPETLNYSTGTPNFNITITKIEQTITAPSNPNFSTEIKEIMANLFDYELIAYTAEDYGIVGKTDISVNANGYLSKMPQNLLTNKTFDANADFVVKIENINASCAWITGIRRELSLDSNEYVKGGDCYKKYNIGFYIKKQNVLFFVGYISDGVWETSIWNIPVELGYIKFIISANKVSYKILN